MIFRVDDVSFFKSELGLERKGLNEREDVNFHYAELTLHIL